ncbi:MAG: hypothetical protein V3T72_15260, partial [Thermoanaerobaculia bacterium]
MRRKLAQGHRGAEACRRRLEGSVGNDCKEAGGKMERMKRRQSWILTVLLVLLGVSAGAQDAA